MKKQAAKKTVARIPHTQIEVPPRQDPKISDKLAFGRIFWVCGVTPKGMEKNDVLDPPTNGRQAAFAFRGEKRWSLFCPITFRSFQVSADSLEANSFEGPPQCFTNDSLAEWLISKWEGYAEKGTQVDYDMAARVIKELGGDVPTVVPITTRDEDPNKERGGKPVADTLLKPVKRTGKRGKVLEWFLETGEARSIREAMAEFEVTRSNVLSYLHNLNKDHGVGYSLVGDTALVTLPADTAESGPWL